MKKGKRSRLAMMLLLAMLTGIISHPVEAVVCNCPYCVIEVTKTGKMLREGSVVKKADVLKAVKVTQKGKKTTNFSIKEKGKTVKGKKFKLTLIRGTKSNFVWVKVNRIKKVYIRQSKQTVLTEGEKFSASKFKKKTIVMAVYQKGADKKITTYVVSAPKTVKANSKGEFVITVKFGKYRDKISIPVVTPPSVTEPTMKPTTEPTTNPTMEPTTEPTTNPTMEPTTEPTMEPTTEPTTEPTMEPTTKPTTEPTMTPTTEPTTNPTMEPTTEPTTEPTMEPTTEPTTEPTMIPTTEPTTEPTTNPTMEPTTEPTTEPTMTPTTEPTTEPTANPTIEPTTEPTIEPYANLTIVRKGTGDVSLNNQLITFSNDTTTQKVIIGSKCTLIASNTSQYKFVRWLIKTNDGEVISTDSMYSINVDKDVEVTAVFERIYTVTVKRFNGKGKVLFDEEEVDFYSNVAVYRTLPGRYDLEAIASDESTFVSWTDVSGKVLSTNPRLSLSVSADIEVYCNFSSENTVTVTYQHGNGQLLMSQAVAFGDTLQPPTKDMWKAGQTFVGWKIEETVYKGDIEAEEFYSDNGNLLSDAIKALTIQKKDVLIESVYTDDPIKYYQLNIEGGTISSYDGEMTDAGVKAGTHVYIKAEVPEDKFFGGWQDADGNMLSFEEEYDFFVNGEMTITAIFSDKEVEKKPVVHFVGNKYEVYPEDYGVRLLMASEIPEGCEKLEWGFLYTSQDLNEEEMILESIAKKVTNRSTWTGNADWTYDAKFSSSIWGIGMTVKFRIYAVVQTTKGTETIYSEIISVPLKTE